MVDPLITLLRCLQISPPISLRVSLQPFQRDNPPVYLQINRRDDLRENHRANLRASLVTNLRHCRQGDPRRCLVVNLQVSLHRYRRVYQVLSLRVNQLAFLQDVLPANQLTSRQDSPLESHRVSQLDSRPDNLALYPLRRLLVSLRVIQR